MRPTLPTALRRFVCALLGLALAALGVLLVVEAVAEVVRLVRAEPETDGLLVPWRPALDTVASTALSADGLLVAAVVAIAVGLLLWLLALPGGKPRVVALRADDERVDAGLSRSSLSRTLAGAAAEVHGVVDTQVDVGRRSATVDATTRGGTDRTRDEVEQRVRDRIDELGLADPPKVKVSTRERAR